MRLSSRPVVRFCSSVRRFTGTGTLLLLAGACVIPAAAQSTTSFVPAVNTVAGGGKSPFCANTTGSNGDNCPATQAALSGPWESVSDAAGNLYIGDSTHKLIRRVDAKTGIITTIAGQGPSCTTASTLGDGCPATQATFATVRGLALGPAGNLVFTDATTSTDFRVRSIDLKTGIITTIAGTGSKASKCPSNTAPLPAAQTPLYVPYGTAFDAQGNLYIADSGNNCIVVVVAKNGVIDPNTSLAYTLAGTGGAVHTGIPGPATAAGIDGPHKISVDAAGNVYVFEFSDYYSTVISNAFVNGQLNLSGATIANFAGTGTVGYTGDGGLATSAQIGPLQGGLADLSGNVELVANGVNYDSVRSVNLATGNITTLLGNGTRANTGDGGPASAAEISGPTDVSYDRFGNLFVNSNSGNVVRSISLDNVFPFTNTGTSSAAQNILATTSADMTLQTAAITPATDFTLGTLSGCAAASPLAANAICTLPVTFNPTRPGVRTAALMLTDASSNLASLPLTGYGIAPQVTFSGAAITTRAGTGTAGGSGNGSAATAAAVSAPRGGMFDGAGNFYFADSGNNQIRRIDASTGNISVVAGTGTAGYAGDHAAATAAQLNAPADVYVDGADNLFIADTGNSVIRYVSAATGVITTIAGTGTAGYTGDGGAPTQATLKNPQGLTVDPGNNIYIADTGNNVIRRFNLTGGPISTTIGTGTAGYSGDGGVALYATLTGPTAVAFDINGNLYIADAGNTVIRQVSPIGQISTFAGRQGGSTNSGDGASAVAATFSNPTDVTTDAAGNVYVASGGQVRMINGSGIIVTIAGSGASESYSGEGGDATKATLSSAVSNIALDGDANLYIADTGGNRLLSVASSTPRALDFGSESVGGTSAAQSVVVTNTGNSPLIIAAVALTASYDLNSSAATECAAGVTLNPGATCTLDITFSPTGNGTTAGSLVLTDNALNNATATQTISLTGVGSSTTPTSTSLTVTPSTLVYGAAATANVTVTNGNSPSGQVTVSVDGVPAGSASLSAGSATVPLSILQSGNHTVTAAYAGDTDNGSSGGTLSITVAPAVVTVTATDATKHQGDPNPTFAYTLSGFVNGDTQSVLSGTPLETTAATTTSTQGTYPITIAQGTLTATNYTFIFQNGTLTVTEPLPPDFTLTNSITAITIAQGQTQTLNISLAPLRGYNGLVTLGCNGLPKNVTCTFNSNTVQMDGSSTLTDTLTVGTIGLATVAGVASPTGGPLWYLLLALALASAALTVFRRRMRLALRAALGALALVMLLSGVSGCADAIGSRVASTGASTFNVTATDASGANKTAPLTVTIMQP